MAPSGTPAVFRFGPYEADSRTRRLRRRGARVQLPGKSFDLLLALLEHPGEVVTRDELRRRLWPQGIFVDFENNLNSTVNRLRAALADSSAKPRFLETVPQLGYRWIAGVEPRGSPHCTLAVLPFVNLNGDPEEDFFADGVADSLTTALGNVGTLRVISRQSVRHLKGTERTVPEIARELNVDVVVEGSVLRADRRIRITAQLVHVAPERHLWAHVYDCELGDILTVQGQVALAIAEAVKVVLTPAEKGRLERPRAVQPDAHLAYLRGLHHMGQWSRESFEKALHCFRTAVELDPAHALAHAQMADCYGMLGNWGHRPFVEAFQSAKQAAMQALALDDTLSTAHWAYAWATWICDWDLVTARVEILRAIALNPSEAHAHTAYSVLLVTTTTDWIGAVAEMRLALTLDPLSPYINALMAWTYLLVRDYDRAREQALKTLDLFPQSLLGWWGLGLAEMASSRHVEAIAAFQKAAEISPEPLSLAYLGVAEARAGHIGTAASFLQQLLSRYDREPVPPRCLAMLYAATGDNGRALEWLERAFQVRDSGLFWLRVMPVYDTLRSHPRFQEMLRRLGLPEN